MSLVLSAAELQSNFRLVGVTPRELLAFALKFNPVVEGVGPLMWPHIKDLTVSDIMHATVAHPDGVMPAIKAMAWEATPLLVERGEIKLKPTREQVEQLLLAVELMLEPFVDDKAIQVLMNARHETGFFRACGALKPNWVAESLEPQAQRTSWVEKLSLGSSTTLHIWGYTGAETEVHRIEHISGYYSRRGKAAGYFEASVLSGDWTDFTGLASLTAKENDSRQIVIAWARLLAHANPFVPTPLPREGSKILVLHDAELLPEICGKGFLQTGLRALWEARQPETWGLCLVNALPAQYPEDLSMLPAEIRTQAYEHQERLVQHAQTVLAGLVPPEHVLGCRLGRT
jgi:hypothetical protein